MAFFIFWTLSRMIRQLVFISVLIFQAFVTHAQTDSLKKNVLYMETGGPGGLVSYSYGRSLLVKPSYDFGLIGGIGAMRFIDFRGIFNPDLVFFSNLNFDFSAARLIGWSEANGFELILGHAMASSVIAGTIDSYERSSKQHGFAGVYYRYNFQKNGLRVRVGFTPILEEYSYFQPWYALTVGYRF